MNLQDTQIIRQRGRWSVLAQQHEVMWRDGTTLALHPVRENGHDSLFHRAIITSTGLVIVFDLRHVCPALDLEVRQLPARDAIGAVYYGLRLATKSAAEVSMLATERHAFAWIAGDDELLAPPPNRRAVRPQEAIAA